MRKIAASELMLNADGSIFHLHLQPEQLADTVILVGDQGRAKRISEIFESQECSQQSREFMSATGLYKGKRMTVLSTGIGTDNIDIVVNELDALVNIDLQTRQPKSEHHSLRLVRLGTCGALQADIPIGSLILSKISIGFDGLLNWYADRDKVSLLDYEAAFVAHMHWAKALPAPYFVAASADLVRRFAPICVSGMTISAPGFYGPQGRVLRLPLIDPDLLEKVEAFRYKDDRICNFEMEGSAIAGLAALLGHEALTVCVAIANRYLQGSNTSYQDMMESAIVKVLDTLAAE
jgi:Uridine phosphorylase